MRVGAESCPVSGRETVVAGVATFAVGLDGRVRVDDEVNAAPVDVQASLDGRVAAALLQQRRTLPLHLAAVVVEGRAVGFAGPPGAGKSGVACALADRGHPLLADDLAGVATHGEGRPTLEPGRRRMRIWGDSARQLGWPADDAHRIKAGVDKYVYALPHRFAEASAPLGAIYVLVEHPGDDLLVDQMTGFAKFEALFTAATYSREYLDTPEARAWHFREVMRLAQQVPMFTVRRPARELPLRRLAVELERHARTLA
jgi:hypothetical protein